MVRRKHRQEEQKEHTGEEEEGGRGRKGADAEKPEDKPA